MSEHLLDAAEVGAAFEQMGRERVPQEMWVDASGLQAGALGESPQDQKRARPGERATLRVEEQLGPVAIVDEGPAVGEVTPQRVGRVAPEGHDAFLAALAGAADQAPLQVDVGLAEPDRLADP